MNNRWNKLRSHTVLTEYEYSRIGAWESSWPDLCDYPLYCPYLFGAKKLPDLARSMGQSMNEFRKAREDIDRDLKEAVAQPSQPRSVTGQQCGAHSRAPRRPRDPVGS